VIAGRSTARVDRAEETVVGLLGDELGQLRLAKAVEGTAHGDPDGPACHGCI
jgi:hypothetical protein